MRKVDDDVWLLRVFYRAVPVVPLLASFLFLFLRTNFL